MIYLRQSTGHQETSLETQLKLNIAQARKMGFHVNATLNDLEFMQRRGLSMYKSIMISRVGN